MKKVRIETIMSIIVGTAIGLTVVIKAIPNWTTYAAPPVSEAIYDIETETTTEMVHIHTVSEKEPQTATEITTEPPTEVETTEYEYYSFIPLSEDIQHQMQEVCDEYEISFELMLSIFKQESYFDSSAVGDNGKAFGLGQIQAQWWEDKANSLGLYDYKTNPVQNTEMSLIVLTTYIDKYQGDLNKALNGYRHHNPNDIVEPDGITYVQHIYNNMSWIEEMKNE